MQPVVNSEMLTAMSPAYQKQLGKQRRSGQGFYLQRNSYQSALGRTNQGIGAELGADLADEVDGQQQSLDVRDDL